MRKMFSTNGTILHDDDGNEVIKLQGDRRHEVAEFLVKYCVVESKEEIHVHGF
jgi:translation initiation factor SUI1